MLQNITEALAAIEQEERVRILFAAEAGSRAWGIASPNSDYDVRFVYVNELDWYLGLRDRRDVIERELPGDLDVAGWDVRKALKLFAKCNVGFNEWFDSPVVYRDDGRFAAQIRGLIPEVFNPKGAVFHYLGTATKTRAANPIESAIKVKKLFYIVRPLLAGHWIVREQTQPPTPMEELLETGLMPETVADALREIRVAKSEQVEAHPISVPEVLRDWIVQSFAELEARAQELSAAPPVNWDRLDQIALANIKEEA